MILRIAIVDDELLYRRILDEKINIWAEKNNIADNMEVSVFEEPESFFKAHLRNPFNIVLMDIYINDMNGIDAALKLRNDENCKVIFLTSSSEYMQDAFRCHAFDYILKPFSDSSIENSLSECVQSLNHHEFPGIILIHEGRAVEVKTDRIMYILSDLNYCIVCADNQKLRCRISFKELEGMLEKYEGFFTVNRGIMVNFRYIADCGDADIKMADDQILSITKKRKKEFNGRYMEWKFDKRVKILTGEHE